MANFTAMPVALASDTFSTDATQRHPLGTVGHTKDGRVFRYCQAGAATVAGTCYQSAAAVALHLANTPPAVAIGATSFVYTPGSTAGAANLYSEGYLQVDTTPGNGYTYQVAGHAAITSGTAFTLNLADAIQVALTTSSRVGLRHHPFKNVIITATTVTAPAVGISPTVINSTEYGWMATKGIASALIDGTPAIGTGLQTSVSVAGALSVCAVAAEIDVRRVARAYQVGVTAKNNFVFLEFE